jgi:hypothetical protein
MQTNHNEEQDRQAGIDARRASKLEAQKADPKTDPRFARTEIKFGNAHIHRGVAYKAGETAIVTAIEADALVKAGYAGIKVGTNNPVDVTHGPGETVAATNSPPPIPPRK